MGISQQVPAVAAGALLHPTRRHSTVATPSGCEAATIDGAGNVALAAWRCAAVGRPRATVVLLHGVADNRASWRSAIARFTRRQFDVVAYDSRANGESGGDACTYGYFEKDDLRRVVDRVTSSPVILIGTSLGAAVALQEAAGDPRIAGVVAAETFSDLRTVATERAPAILPAAVVRRAFGVAERQAGFSVDAVSPVAAAPHIDAPVLLIHGADDVDTPPDHSRRVYRALRGRKRLMIVAGARHNGSLATADVWRAIDDWIEASLPRR